MDITALAQLWVAKVLREGDLAVDATVGNGHDTVFLARMVGRSGRVIGFDVQEGALVAARENLARVEEGLLEWVVLLRRSHAEMKSALREARENRRPKAIMFNLGYLPTGDKSVTTLADETMRALADALDLLAPHGILTTVLYPGHPEGQRETEAVLEWAKNLAAPFEAILSRPLNRAGTAPCLVAVERKA
ncbi:MAG: class I SAM-dependent methyltransferase [Opitutales bacterium]